VEDVRWLRYSQPNGAFVSFPLAFSAFHAIFLRKNWKTLSCELTRFWGLCSLGLMIVGEMFTYWALMHCFVVAMLVNWFFNSVHISNFNEGWLNHLRTGCVAHIDHNLPIDFETLNAEATTTKGLTKMLPTVSRDGQYRRHSSIWYS
jgi:hypothetical protein